MHIKSRDLNAAVKRMSTLSGTDRIGLACVNEEIDRLRSSWNPTASADCISTDLEALLGRETADKLDRFDRVQLEDVLLVCLKSSSLAEAGRILFAESRTRRKTANDSDRVRKYLQSWGITWEDLRNSRE